MTIVDSIMRDEVLNSEYRERAKIMVKLDTEKPMLFAFIISKLSHDSEDELKRHPNYSTLNITKDPLQLKGVGATPSCDYRVQECRLCVETGRKRLYDLKSRRA